MSKSSPFALCIVITCTACCEEVSRAVHDSACRMKASMSRIPRASNSAASAASSRARRLENSSSSARNGSSLEVQSRTQAASPFARTRAKCRDDVRAASIPRRQRLLPAESSIVLPGKAIARMRGELQQREEREREGIVDGDRGVALAGDRRKSRLAAEEIDSLCHIVIVAEKDGAVSPRSSGRCSRSRAAMASSSSRTRHLPPPRGADAPARHTLSGR